MRIETINLRRLGFTLVEIIVVIAVIAVLTAILVPVVANAKRKGLETQSVSNMRQLHVAIELYRADYPGTLYGSMESMGLPISIKEQWLGTAVRDLKPPTGPYYNYFPARESIDRRIPTWAQYTLVQQDKTVMIADPWFNPIHPDPPMRYYWTDPNVKKYVIGITLGGSLRRHTASGHIDLDWWDK